MTTVLDIIIVAAFAFIFFGTYRFIKNKLTK